MGRFCITVKWPNPGLFYSDFGRSLSLSYLTFSTALVRSVHLLDPKKYKLLNLTQALTARELLHFENFLGLISLPSPVDSRPSTNKLDHFVQKKRRKKSDMWHVTSETWHMTRDMRHVTCDMFWGVNILSKCQLPSSSGLWSMIFWRLGGKGSLP